MDTVDLIRKAEEEDRNNVLLYNPLDVDFQGKFDGQELPEYRVPSKENKKFKTSLAKHFGKHIADLYKASKGKNYPLEKALKMVMQE